MQGTLSLGKEVVQTLTRFLGDSIPMNARRSLMPLQEDKITEVVKMSLLCRDLDLCQEGMHKFVNEYVTVQAKGMENLLNALLNGFNSDVYELRLKHTLDSIRLMLKEDNGDNNDENIWINIVKKISGKFQEMTLSCAEGHLQVDRNKMDKKLTQKFILATVIVEMKYLNKLCYERHLCVKRYDCTISLNSILEHLKITDEAKARTFIKFVYEALYDTPFYNYLSETTAHEFQVVLNDMAYSDSVPTKELLSAVQKIIAARLQFITTNTDEKLSHDSLLLHAILTDLDNIYSKKSNPFAEFLNYFFTWVSNEESVNISKHIRDIIEDIGKYLKLVSNELLDKLTGEVRAFLEMTVDSD
ncbi:unnamed protein product [Leptosia nina]|uniref:Uncharacterized protein n=1 Tax=Leptosia nina TaxID=320188 RepID=A0AAV1JHR7_9NEOP